MPIQIVVCPLRGAVRQLLLVAIAIMALLTSHQAVGAERVEDINLPQELWTVAYEYAKAKGMDLAKTSVDQLYRVAKGLSNHDGTRDKALQILHILADDGSLSHAPSQVALGMFYYKQARHQPNSKDGENNNDPRQRALNYFLAAGEGGGSTAAMYNAGRIYAELGQFVPAMAYVYAAATAGHDDTDSSDEDHNQQHGHYLEETAVEAFEILSHKVAILVQSEEITLREYADVFFYANLHNEEESEGAVASLWKEAMLLADRIDKANATLVKPGNLKTSTTSLSPQQAAQFQADLVQQLDSLVQLWALASNAEDPSSISMLQGFLLLHHVLYRVLLPLVSWPPLLENTDDKNERYIPAAAGYAEALVLSPFCSLSTASNDHRSSLASIDNDDDGSSCLEETAQLALGLYQQANDRSGIRRMKELLLQQQQQQRGRYYHQNQPHRLNRPKANRNCS